MADHSNVTNLFDSKPLLDIDEIDRPNIRISTKSNYKDSEWDIGEFETNPNIKPSFPILRWNYSCGKNEHFGDDKFTNLRNSFKELIFAQASQPIRKTPSPGTLKNNYTDTRAMFTWLIEHNFTCLSQLKREDLTPYIVGINSNDNYHPTTRRNKLEACKQFWIYRDQIINGINFDPLSGESSYTASNCTREELADNKYEFIPDDIAQDLIRSSIRFIREHGTFVAAAAIARDTANLDQIKQGKSKANRDRAKKAALKGMQITNAEVTTLSRQLLASCYLILGFFTGVRASEMLSMEPDRITKRDGVTWIKGRQYKIQKKSRSWMAPDVVHEAHHLAKALTQPMRDSIEFEISNTKNLERLVALKELKKSLFLNWSSKRKHGLHFEHAPQVSTVNASIHTSLKELTSLFNIVDNAGVPWNLHPHQLRKSYVRFMCANSMNIRYLQEHMGHRSLDMTAWYDTDDVELTQEIIAGIKELKSSKLNKIFNENQKTAGAAAAPLNNERRDYFVGIASERDQSSFVEDLADDITMRSTGHSWCLGDSNNGDCTGVIGCMADVRMTKKCKSALITEEHLPAWTELKSQNMLLLESDQLGRYQKEAIKQVIEDTIEPTIAALT